MDWMASLSRALITTVAPCRVLPATLPPVRVTALPDAAPIWISPPVEVTSRSPPVRVVPVTVPPAVSARVPFVVMAWMASVPAAWITTWVPCRVLPATLAADSRSTAVPVTAPASMLPAWVVRLTVCACTEAFAMSPVLVVISTSLVLPVPEPVLVMPCPVMLPLAVSCTRPALVISTMFTGPVTARSVTPPEVTLRLATSRWSGSPPTPRAPSRVSWAPTASAVMSMWLPPAACPARMWPPAVMLTASAAVLPEVMAVMVASSRVVMLTAPALAVMEAAWLPLSAMVKVPGTVMRVLPDASW